MSKWPNPLNATPKERIMFVFRSCPGVFQASGCTLLMLPKKSGSCWYAALAEEIFRQVVAHSQRFPQERIIVVFRSCKGNIVVFVFARSHFFAEFLLRTILCRRKIYVYSIAICELSELLHTKQFTRSRQKGDKEAQPH